MFVWQTLADHTICVPSPVPESLWFLKYGPDTIRPAPALGPVRLTDVREH